jgi:hypothetical protein
MSPKRFHCSTDQNTCTLRLPYGWSTISTSPGWGVRAARIFSAALTPVPEPWHATPVRFRCCLYTVLRTLLVVFTFCPQNWHTALGATGGVAMDLPLLCCVSRVSGLRFQKNIVPQFLQRCFNLIIVPLYVCLKLHFGQFNSITCFVLYMLILRSFLPSPAPATSTRTGGSTTRAPCALRRGAGAGGRGCGRGGSCYVGLVANAYPDVTGQDGAVGADFQAIDKRQVRVAH